LSRGTKLLFCGRGLNVFLPQRNNIYHIPYTIYHTKHFLTQYPKMYRKSSPCGPLEVRKPLFLSLITSHISFLCVWSIGPLKLSAISSCLKLAWPVLFCIPTLCINLTVVLQFNCTRKRFVRTSFHSVCKATNSIWQIFRNAAFSEVLTFDFY